MPSPFVDKLRQELSLAQLDKLAPIKLAVFDVDGVLTDGKLNFLADGSEVKNFNTLDGLGIKLLAQGDIKTAIITGRCSPQVERRAAALGIDYLYQGREDKLTALQELWQDTGFSAQQTAYIGDDLPDLAAIRAVNFGATVNGGHQFVAAHADWCTQRTAGNGAGREFCETILAGQGKLEALYREYL
ncbi:HAD hydrolase family protein [Amphritea sp. 1_MG-2023]|uniref:KdsC family phosphatase n=1 Tax=Amphritea sp. 1_MG-2023 TaxID=3062670 RepID=UPI0026E37566|nr:HAD hydrolase family protein [Amphritea sp. 1_MG-2023]MDO6564061.1 HAD hydrolase family protein [Amphritea sp. 1_MG-2023]